MDRPTYGLVGRGSVATHMARYLEFEDRRVIRWHRGLGRSPALVLSDAEIVLLAISDDALEAFTAENPALGDRRLVHFSGSHVFDGIHGLHPLMTFGPELYDLEFYRSIPFVSERGGAGFQELFPGLGNPSWAVEPADKDLYHALCVLSGNFTTILWAKAMEDFESRLGLPGDALRPYLERIAANTLDLGREALTGSLARGDRSTIARDLEGLRGDPFAEVYRAFTRAFDSPEVGS